MAEQKIKEHLLMTIECLKHLANSFEENIKDYYQGQYGVGCENDPEGIHPAMVHRYYRDINDAVEARILVEKLEEIYCV